MGQEGKNLLRAQSQYGLMGSSAKSGKKFFDGSQEQFLDKTVIWDRTLPHLYVKCSVYVWGRAQGSQIFKRNSIISIRSKVMTFLVILLSPPMLSPSSLSSPHRPRRPHVVPTLSRRSPDHSQPPDSQPIHPPSTLGVGGPESLKNTIRFELIEIF